jgi:hypothetical protein
MPLLECSSIHIHQGLVVCLMGTNCQSFPLFDNTDGAAVDQVQQQHLLSLSYIDLHWVNICFQVIISIFC